MDSQRLHRKDILLDRLNSLATSALLKGGDKLLLESSISHIPLNFIYTETHLALQLYLLNKLGQREKGLEESRIRLKIWESLKISPIFFNSMAIALLGLLSKQDDEVDPEFTQVLADLQGRNSETSSEAWERNCGNNMYLQQLATDLVFSLSLKIEKYQTRLPESLRKRLDPA